MESTTITAKVINSRMYDNGWAVMSCVQGAKNYFRAAGTLLIDHESLKDTICDMTGHWENSPRFGNTFKFDNISPAGSEMYFFLSKVVKVGSNVAQEMVDTLGDDTIQAIMEDPSRHKELLRVKGIGHSKLSKIVDSWAKHRDIKLLSDFLTPYGITSNLVMRIHVHFEDKAVQLIKSNPYVLTQVRGIGFRKADEIALKLGTVPHDRFRIESCIKYVMSNIADNSGHTLVEQQEVVIQAKQELETEKAVIDSDEIEMVIAGMLVDAQLVEVSGKLALSMYNNIEKRILHSLKQRLTMTPCRILSPADTEKFIESMQVKMGIKGFSEEQKTAIRLVAAGHKTIVICGYAGTGKSTISKALLHLLMIKHSDDEVCCMALSGIASDRIRKTSGFMASTIHTALGWKGNQFEFGADRQLGHKVVLLDESSMVNSTLMKQVIEAVDRDAVLILMGDPGQLPPIGAGDPFRDIIESEIVPVAKLTKIYRQSDNSVLTMFANDIRQGIVPDGYLKPGGFKDFEFVERNLPRKYYDAEDKEKEVMRNANHAEIIDFIKSRLTQAAPHIKNVVSDIQVLSPIRKGALGTESLNQLTQSVLNPIDENKPVVHVGNATFHIGDKVVHTQNKNMEVASGSQPWDYMQGEKVERRVFNGSVGQVVDVDTDNREVMVAYPDGFVTVYDSLLLSSYTLIHAFSLTAHKCQGSEYKCVIFPVSSSHMIMLTAQWLYTAMTRASQKVVIVGQKYMFERCCKKLVENRRTTVLEKLLKAPSL